MTSERSDGVTRRAAIVTGIAGATVAAVTASGGGQALGGQSASGASSSSPRMATGDRMPVVYVPHGGGPWPFVDLGMKKTEHDALADYLKGLHALPKIPPKSLLVISAHWEEPVFTVMTSERPPMLYDYYGFPPESYQITWPAPGAPKLARRVRELLSKAEIASGEDATRGFDHGTFVPFKLTYPNADIPTIQLSLKVGLDPEEHIAMGRALQPLRDEGVFILGSGLSFHNMNAFRDPRAAGNAGAFDAWLRETSTLDQTERTRRLSAWATAPGARQSHPREEHLLPLMVVAGAAGDDRGGPAFAGTLFGHKISAIHFG